MKFFKIIIFIFILFGLAAIFYFVGWPIYKEKFKEKEITSDNVQIFTPKEKNEIPQTYEEVAEYLEKNINNLVEFQSSFGGWQVKRLGFVDKENVYVEIEDGHSLFKVLFSCKKQKDEFRCYNLARFEPENFQWKVVEGKDAFASREVFYYEKNNKKWQKTTSSSTTIYFPISFDSLLEIQKAVDRGYILWRRAPLSVLRHDLPAKFNFDINRDKFKPIKYDEENGRIVYQIIFQNKEVWQVKLFQPIKKGEGGIWIIEEMVRIK